MKFRLFARKKNRYISRLEKALIIVAVIVITTVIVKAADRKVNNDITSETSENNGCPADMTYVSAVGGGFCLDKYEVSPGDKCPYTEPTNQNHSLANIDSRECRPESKSAALPWRFISQNQAEIACAKAGKRLPTNKEWQSAALGTPDLTGKWGSEDCNVASNWPNNPGQTGFAVNCVSAAGAYDMIGNVWEWVEGNVTEGKYHDKQLPDEGYVTGVGEDGMPIATTQTAGDANYYLDYFWVKSAGVKAIARGGYWNNQSDAGQYSTYIVLSPSDTGPGIGFRCVK